MTVTAERARELLYAAHDAWNVRDIERLVSLFVEDMTYWSNAGGPDGGGASRSTARTPSGSNCEHGAGAKAYPFPSTSASTTGWAAPASSSTSGIPRAGTSTSGRTGRSPPTATTGSFALTSITTRLRWLRSSSSPRARRRLRDERKPKGAPAEADAQYAKLSRILRERRNLCSRECRCLRWKCSARPAGSSLANDYLFACARRLVTLHQSFVWPVSKGI